MGWRGRSEYGQSARLMRDLQVLKIPHPAFGHPLPVGEGALDYLLGILSTVNAAI
jgi:hypothetical protein